MLAPPVDPRRVRGPARDRGLRSAAVEGADIQTLILCGGKGTRAYPHTETVPKPLLDVDGEPILGHVLRIYARQGFTEFILAAGYLAERVEEFASTMPADWEITVVDTGEETNTGGRVARCRELLRERFMVNYADGLGNVDIRALLDFHDAHDGSATLTTVPLPSQYGTIDADSTGRVTNFREKPRLFDHYINGGYFVFDQSAFDHWDGEDLERDVLPALGASGELFAFRHEGFWKSMDTYKDALALTEIAAGDPPWMQLPVGRTP